MDNVVVFYSDKHQSVSLHRDVPCVGRLPGRQSPPCPEGSTSTRTPPPPVLTGAASSSLSRNLNSPTTTWTPSDT